MKISKQRLRQIIKEEMQNMFEQEQGNPNVALANAALGMISGYQRTGDLRTRADKSQKLAKANAEFTTMRKTGNAEVVKDGRALMFLKKVKDLQSRDPELFADFSKKGEKIEISSQGY